jgi:hypothetical protein
MKKIKEVSKQEKKLDLELCPIMGVNIKDFKEIYVSTLEVMGWDMKETFEEWLQRMEDIDSFLIQDNL